MAARGAVVLATLLAWACQPTPQEESAGPQCFGKCDSPAKRASWVVAEINDHNAGLSDDLRAGKYEKMAESAHAFFRGTNHLYWADLADDKRVEDFGGKSTRIWLQGDVHACNFGSFNNDDGTIVYDLNDHDEGVVADYKLDLWRLATSLVLVIDENNAKAKAAAGEADAGEVIDSDGRSAALDALCESYLSALDGYRGNDLEKARIFTQGETSGMLADFLAKVAQKKTRAKMLSKWTKVVDGQRVLLDAADYAASGEEAELESVDAKLAQAIQAAMKGYLATLSSGKWATGYFDLKSVRRRLGAGTGSYGAPRYYLLIEGETTSLDDDRILDVKLQGAPSAYPYLASGLRAITDKAAQTDGQVNHALRAIRAAKALGVHVDDHLGWMKLPEGLFSARELSPAKDDVDPADLDTVALVKAFATTWGTILATAHARADNDHDSQVIGSSFEKQVGDATQDKHEAFCKQVRQVAVGYALQVSADYSAFLASLE